MQIAHSGGKNFESVKGQTDKISKERLTTRIDRNGRAVDCPKLSQSSSSRWIRVLVW